ncbi:hypothetical protein [Hahella ganghwensis]|uniref:hypothetical protein n=1 Tax=Hahella ganghwensis TaxID=286420 RepID=UPI00036B8CF9|nr:hypothetical protein [Hahella ganghwensis]
MNLKCLIAIPLILMPGLTLAVDIQQTEISKTATDTFAIEHSEAERIHWGLSEKEWSRYQVLMETDAKYQFANLPPVFVLGIYADNVTDRERYARLLILQDKKRMDGFKAFEAVHDRVGREIFAGIPFIDYRQIAQTYNLPDNQKSQASNLPKLGDTLVMFVNSSDQESISKFETARQISLKTAVALEVYFMQATTDKQIQAWAKAAKIDPEDVEKGAITLNYDNGESKVFGLDEIQTKLFNVRGNEAVPLQF